MSDITRLTAAEIAARIASGELTAVQVTEAHLARIEAVDEKVHAFLHVDREGALAQAREVDAKRERGEKLGPLAGVPLALKDIFTTEGVPTTVGSKILEGWIPPYDATVTKRLKAAGVVILGKTNMDEFAMGSSTENSAYGPTGNPWDLTRIPGGSGGGSSAALAAFQAPLAIGTDTGGSIRQPAAVTGTVGVKPTYGGVSRYGMVAFSSSLDQGGPCARTVLDAALLHEVIAGHDPMDSTSVDAPVPAVVEAARNGSVEGMRVGVVKQFRGEGYQAGVIQRFDESVELLKSLGAEIVELDCPSFDLALSAYYLIAPSECSSNLARFDGLRYGLRTGDDGTHSAEEVTSLTREGRLRPRGQAARHARHVRPQLRLLRRVLRQRPEGPHPHQAGVRAVLRAGRRDRLPDDPDHRLPDRRARRRPDGDVPGRPVHHPHQPGGQRGHVAALRPRPRGQPAGGSADHRPRHEGRPAVQGRRRRRGRLRGTVGPPADRGGTVAVSALTKAKGFKKSKSGTYMSMAATAFGAIGVAKQIKKARVENDTLRLVDAVVTAAGVVTGLALLYRELKRLGDDDVLLG